MTDKNGEIISDPLTGKDPEVIITGLGVNVDKEKLESIKLKKLSQKDGILEEKGHVSKPLNVVYHIIAGEEMRIPAMNGGKDQQNKQNKVRD